MKRRVLLSHLKKNGCKFLREGGKHTIFVNPDNNRVSTVPRHSEISDILARKICKDLGISPP